MPDKDSARVKDLRGTLPLQAFAQGTLKLWAGRLLQGNSGWNRGNGQSKNAGKCRNKTRSHREMVRDTSRVTLNFDLSKIPFVHF